MRKKPCIIYKDAQFENTGAGKITQIYTKKMSIFSEKRMHKWQMPKSSHSGEEHKISKVGGDSRLGAIMKIHFLPSFQLADSPK